MNKWYVYIHFRNDTQEPFYVGKGTGKRAFLKKKRSTHWKNIVEKHGYRIEFDSINITNDEAKKREIHLIKKIGRRDLGLGTLVNFTDGGEGSSGRPMNDKTKKILTLSNKNRPKSLIQNEMVRSLYKGKFGINHNRSKSIICIETGNIYGSMSEAERELKLGGGSVSWSVKHKKPIYGLHFILKK